MIEVHEFWHCQIGFRPPFYVEINWKWAAVYTEKSDIAWYCEWLVMENVTVADFNADLPGLIKTFTVLMGKRNRGLKIQTIIALFMIFFSSASIAKSCTSLRGPIAILLPLCGLSAYIYSTHIWFLHLDLPKLCWFLKQTIFVATMWLPPWKRK